MRQLATAAHQPSAFHVMPRVALSSKHHRFLAGEEKKKSFCFDEHTHSHTHIYELAVTYTAHNPRLIFAFSQSRSGN